MGMSTGATMNAAEENIGLGATQIRFLLTGAHTSGAMSVFEMVVAAGHKIPAPAHKNDAYEEMLYGISGVLTWTVDGTPFAVGPGQALCIPRGAVHRFDNFGSADAKQLVVVSPAILGPVYFRDMSETIRGAVAAGTPPDPKTMIAILQRNGMTIAAPPPAR